MEAFIENYIYKTYDIHIDFDTVKAIAAILKPITDKILYSNSSQEIYTFLNPLVYSDPQTPQNFFKALYSITIDNFSDLYGNRKKIATRIVEYFVDSLRFYFMRNELTPRKVFEVFYDNHLIPTNREKSLTGFLPRNWYDPYPGRDDKRQLLYLIKKYRMELGHTIEDTTRTLESYLNPLRKTINSATYMDLHDAIINTGLYS